MSSVPQLTPAEARELLARDAGTVLLDVREDWEFARVHVEGSRPIPMYELPERLDELNPGHTLVVLCHHGNRSQQVAAWLQTRGYTVNNVAGGIEAWATDLDPALPRY
ncbi:MAG TPA: rhodanese-like domain-containing protein [Gammaproteobacteria bacterium]|nr:rhodanese-like domain-containing protein [Gammaproteobacteria bacterium]